VIAEVLATVEMLREEAVQNGPFEQPGSLNGLTIDRFLKQWLQACAKPLMRRYIEAFLLARQHRLREFVTHQLAQHML